MFHNQVRSVARQPGRLESTNIQLVIRQQPREALVTQANKEKSRKPVDPPPIVEMKVNLAEDPQSQFLVSPYLFMLASLVPVDESRCSGEDLRNALIGQTSSSLHRLKDTTSESDGGFFVFGDLSVRKLGRFYLKFMLFEMSRNQGSQEVDCFLKTEVTSDAFTVVPQKDFKGLSESSSLSRTFSDQGVKLRCRKEAKSISAPGKRSYEAHTASPPSNYHHSYSQLNQHNSYSYGDHPPPPPTKKRRLDGERPNMLEFNMYPSSFGGFVDNQGSSTRFVSNPTNVAERLAGASTFQHSGMRFDPHSYAVQFDSNQHTADLAQRSYAHQFQAQMYGSDSHDLKTFQSDEQYGSHAHSRPNAPYIPARSMTEPQRSVSGTLVKPRPNAGEIVGDMGFPHTAHQSLKDNEDAPPIRTLGHSNSDFGPGAFSSAAQHTPLYQSSIPAYAHMHQTSVSDLDGDIPYQPITTTSFGPTSNVTSMVNADTPGPFYAQSHGSGATGLDRLDMGAAAGPGFGGGYGT